MTDGTSIPAPLPVLQDMMIDLETFSTSNSAGVVQAGLVCFDDNVPSNQWMAAEWVVTLQSSLLLGGEVDPETVAFWGGARPNSPSEEARSAICGADQAAVPLGQVLLAAKGMWQAFGCQRVWSHGSCFDITILNGYYQRARMVPPWRYTNVRDTRTLFSLAEDLTGWTWARGATAHTALADAKDQASAVVEARRALRSLTGPAPGEEISS